MAESTIAPASQVRQAAKVGVGVLVVRQDGQVLVGKRKGKLGGGEYALPGGHLEYGESFEACAVRELEEETALVVDPCQAEFVHAVNTVFDSGAHYVTIFMRVNVPPAAQPRNVEPGKCEGWQFVELSAIPQPVFLPLQKLLESGSYRQADGLVE